MAIPDESPDTVRARAESLVENTGRIVGDLNRIRRQHGLTEQDVADRLGWDLEEVQWVGRYYEHPTLPQIRRYALAVGALIHVTIEEDPSFVKEATR